MKPHKTSCFETHYLTILECLGLRSQKTGKCPPRASAETGTPKSSSSRSIDFETNRASEMAITPCMRPHEKNRDRRVGTTHLSDSATMHRNGRFTAREVDRVRATEPVGSVAPRLFDPTQRENPTSTMLSRRNSQLLQ